MIDNDSAFTVYTSAGYVASVADGRITYTADAARAMPFCGANWLRTWAGVRGAMLMFGGMCAARERLDEHAHRA